MTTSTLQPAKTGPRAALSRELSEFLIEFSIGVHRYAMYPPGHPSLDPVLENIIARLARLFEDRRTLAIGVARRQLVIEGVATDPKHPVLSDLARRLHGHQIGALTMEYGARAVEIQGLLAALSEDLQPDDVPLGLRPEHEIPSWEHLAIHPVGYDRLELTAETGDAAQGDRAMELWVGLAQAALAGGATGADGSEDTGVLARSIREHAREAKYDEVIVEYLLELAEELGRAGAGTERIQRQLTSLIRDMDSETLTRLVELGGDAERRRRFVLDANHSLAVDAVVKVLRSAAEASQQTISNSMTRLLGKLAQHAEQGAGGVRAQASTALRENVSELISEWELRDPNPEAYTTLLDAMAHAAPIFRVRVERDEGERSGARRLVEMALEVGAFGPTVERAVLDLIDEGEAALLLDLVGRAPEAGRAGTGIIEYLTRPAQVRRLLAAGDIDRDALQCLVDRMGPEVVETLVEVLVESDSRAARRTAFDVLTGLDAEPVGEAAMARLDDGRWYVVRNMLALLQRLETLPPGLDPARWVAHGDERVRREALPLALRIPATRDRAVTQALSDPDERVVRIGLVELKDGVPEVLVPTLVNRVLKAERSDEIRALGIRCLRDTRSKLVRDTLVGLADGGRTLLGKARVAERSIVVLASLEVLHREWADDEGVRDLLDAARRSKDPLIRRSVGER